MRTAADFGSGPDLSLALLLSSKDPAFRARIGSSSGAECKIPMSEQDLG
ncbi:MAG: hypothetical protein MI919_04020 [Holophagales bacterium]|nr:hypothetical protein [Holophagales bacterium]